MKIFCLAASLRKASFNKKLALLAAAEVDAAGAQADLADFREFDMPLYDGDLEAASGVPEGARKLAARIAAAEGIALATPEYNASIPGTLKNAIDWCSRLRPHPFRGKTCLFLSASPGPFGGVRGVLHARVSLEALGTIVWPETFNLAGAGSAFDPQGQLLDVALRQRLSALVKTFTSATALLSNPDK